MDEETAVALQALLKHPSWPFLEREIEAAHERYLQRLTKSIAAGTIPDQRDLDFMRGRFDGARLIVKQAGRGVKHLEQLQEQRAREREDS